MPHPDTTSPARFRLASWLVEPLAGRLSRGNEAHHLEPKVMGVLVALADAQGEVVTRDALFAAVWPDVVVTDSALNRSVSDLRRALGDDSRRPRYVETVPTVGYRLLVPPEPVEPDSPPDFQGDGAQGDGSGAHALPYPDDPPSLALTTDAPEASRARPTGRRWMLAATLVGLTLASFLWRTPEPPAFTATLDPATAHVLTTRPGAETHAQLSPDGTRLAYVGTDGGAPALFVQALAASSPTRLAANAYFPTWSPDGARLAFLRPNREGDLAIVEVTAYGTDERVLTSGGIRPSGLSWSPSGDVLAFVHRDGRRSGISLYRLETGERVRLTDAVGARDFNPVVSPSGESVAFVRHVGPGDTRILTVPTSGGEPTVRVADAGSVAGLALTPGGRSIVFSSNRTGLYRLWEAGLNGSLRALTVPSQDPGSPSISRTGTLAFADWRYDTNVWTASAGDEPRALYPAAGWDEEPALSPDGLRVAFVSTRSGAQEIWTGPVVGAEPMRLTFRNGGAVRAPRWSPDGQWIAFQAQEDGAHDVFVVPSAGGTPRPVAAHPADDVNPRWSRDGRRLYFGSERSGRWRVWQADIESGDASPVTPDGYFVAEERPGGAGLFAVRAGRDSLVAVSPDGTARPIAPLATADWNNWGVTERGPVVLDRREAPARLFFPDEGTHETATLPAVPAHASAVSVSADGRSVAWTRVDQAENDVLILEPARE